MSSIITAILESTVGLLCEKARDSAANKLKDGDLADEKLREIIVQDLTDIKSKLDCLSLKDLDSSYSFLREGIELLNIALNKSNKDHKAIKGFSHKATRFANVSASDVLSAVSSYSQAIQSLKVSSGKLFVSAEDCFKASREAATHAFNNKSLSIKDRIIACKLRVAARILESGLDDPGAATAACLLSLRELHGLPAIQEMFAVFLKGGLKSMLKKAERLENIMSVLSINHVLYDFASKYCRESHYLFTWPVIELRGSTFHPVLTAHEVLKKTSSSVEFLPQLNRVVVDPRICGIVGWFAVNSRGDIILLDDYKMTVFYSRGESKDVVLPQSTEGNVFPHKPADVAVDGNDNVYIVIVRQLKKSGWKKYDFVLYVFDKNYNNNVVSVLDFLRGWMYSLLKIAVDKNENLYMITLDNQVYVCDNAGKLKFKFERDGNYLHSLSISNNNDIMMVSNDRRTVQIYTIKGNLKSTINVPEGHDALKVAFHHGMRKIIVLTYVRKQNSRFILSFFETGELENSVLLSIAKTHWLDIEMKSNPSGPVAIFVNKSITLI